MKHNGLNFVRNNDYGWRHGNPEKDVNLRGEPVESNYVVIVKMRDCPTYERDGRTYYEPANSPSIPMSHGGTYYGYGQWKQRKSTAGIWMRNLKDEEVLAHEYWQSTVYLVHDAVVYTTTLRKPEEPFVVTC